MNNKKAFVTLVIFWIASSSYGQTNDISWYKCLKGKIGKDSITMHLLKKSKDSYSGYYYWNAQQLPIEFRGTYVSKTDSIWLDPYMEIGLEQTLFLKERGNKYTGKWIRESGWVENADGSGSNKPKRILSFSAQATLNSIFAFDIISIKKEIKLRSNLIKSPKAYFSASIPLPREDTPEAEYIKQVIKETLRRNSDSLSIQEILSRRKKRFFREYQESYTRATEHDLETYTGNYEQGESHKIHVVYQDARILSIVYNFIHGGGRNTANEKKFLTLDLINKRELTLSSILTKRGIKEISPLIKKEYLRFTRYSTDTLTTLEDCQWLVANPITEPSKGFYVTSKGIGFNCTPDWQEWLSSTPYVVFIPFTAISTYLQPDFKELIFGIKK